MLVTDALIGLSLTDMLGAFGACIYMANFGLLTLRVHAAQDWSHMILNMAAACLVLVSLWGAFNAAATIIQCFWIATTLVGMALRVSRRGVRGDREARIAIRPIR